MEPQYSADWGDYLSFTTHMHELADKLGVDLLIVDTGDRIEGFCLWIFIIIIIITVPIPLHAWLISLFCRKRLK